MEVQTVIRTLAKALGVALLLALVAGVTIHFMYVRVPDPHGYYQRDPLAPEIPTNVTTPRAQLKERQRLQGKARRRVAAQRATEVGTDKQILFGDTHVHTTWSFDAFMFSLPIMNASNGAYPPAAVCDYARFVSQLDFYFLTDHAESYTSRLYAVSACGTDIELV